jgi:hypothetical protein
MLGTDFHFETISCFCNRCFEDCIAISSAEEKIREGNKARIGMKAVPFLDCTAIFSVEERLGKMHLT